MADAGSDGEQLRFDADEEDLQVFLEDGSEQLEMLDQDIVRLEQEPDDEILQGIFRAAHSLKGSSATIDHTRMAELTHAMESVLDAVRKKTLPITTPIIDALLESLDALRVLLEEVATLRGSGMEFSPLAARLQTLLAGGTAEGEAAPAAASAISVGAGLAEAMAAREATGLQMVEVRVCLAPDCAMPAVRLFQCLVELNANGEVLTSAPSSAQIESEEVGGELVALFATDREPGQVAELLRPVLDVAAVEATAYNAGGEAATAAVAGEPVDQRGAGSTAPEAEDSRRRIDLGPEARGKSSDDQLRLAASKLSQQAKSVRIDVERLDSLMNLTGELVIDRGRLAAVAHRFGAGAEAVDAGLLDALNDTTSHLGLITTELQDQVMKARMQPVANVFHRFPRMVRDLAQRAGKEVDLRISGEDTELDRSVIEEIGDPLIHLLRNAVDHGLEAPDERRRAGKPSKGVLQLSSGHEDNAIVIRVQDDGRGIDPEKIKAQAIRKGLISSEAAERLGARETLDLIWMPGFTTAAEVTEVSGRGVGMDVVKTNIEKLNGTASLESEVGVGTTLTVRVPLTLAVIQGLALRVQQSRLVVPLSAVTETLQVHRSEIKRVHGGQAIQLRGKVLPVIDLAEVLQLRAGPSEETAGGGAGEEERFVVAVRTAADSAGLIVDELLGQEEVVIKSLGSLLRRVPGVSGATLMGDEVALILDVPNLLKLHRSRQGAAA